MSLLFEGVSVAVTTPMLASGEVDFDSFREHLEFLKENKMQGFIINGTTGEGTTLTAEEYTRLFEIALDVANKELPVIAGTGSNITSEAVLASVAAQELGVDALLVITPYYNKTDQRGAIHHFTTIADAVDIPIILYDVPSRTGMTLEPETVAELSKHENIVAIKDATGNLSHLTQMMNLVDDDFAFYSGNDDTTLQFYATGGHGLISVVGNVIPKEHQHLYELSLTDPRGAADLNRHLFKFTQEIGKDLNPLSIKAVVSHLGYGEYNVRLPLYPLGKERVEELVQAYQAVKEGMVIL